VFDNFRARLLSFLSKTADFDKLSVPWERGLIYEIRVPEWAAVKASSETDGSLLKNRIVSALSPAIAGLQLG
jgi:hypothetical protein